MTKKLEELFDLAISTPITNNSNDLTNVSNQITSNMSILEQYDKLFESVEYNDKEMDNYAEIATSTFKDLMDLGMNVEAKYSSSIFEVANKMLGHAINAKTQKIEKQLKAFELQYKSQSTKQNNTANAEKIIPGMVIDRNELINSMKK